MNDEKKPCSLEKLEAQAKEMGERHPSVTYIQVLGPDRVKAGFILGAEKEFDSLDQLNEFCSYGEETLRKMVGQAPASSSEPKAMTREAFREIKGKALKNIRDRISGRCSMADELYEQSVISGVNWLAAAIEEWFKGADE